MFESACRMNGGVMFVLSAGSRALSQREPPQSFFDGTHSSPSRFFFIQLSPPPSLSLSLSLILFFFFLFFFFFFFFTFPSLLCVSSSLYSIALSRRSRITQPPRHFYLIRKRKASGSARSWNAVHTHTHTHTQNRRVESRARPS